MTNPGLALILFYLMSPKVAQLYSVQLASSIRAGKHTVHKHKQLFTLQSLTWSTRGSSHRYTLDIQNLLQCFLKRQIQMRESSSSNILARQWCIRWDITGPVNPCTVTNHPTSISQCISHLSVFLVSTLYPIMPLCVYSYLTNNKLYCKQHLQINTLKGELKTAK